MLLPAVQKVRESASRVGESSPIANLVLELDPLQRSLEGAQDMITKALAAQVPPPPCAVALQLPAIHRAGMTLDDARRAFPPGPSRGQDDDRALRSEPAQLPTRLNVLGHHLMQYVHLAGGCEP